MGNPSDRDKYEPVNRSCSAMQCDSPWSAELLRWKQRLQLRWQSFGFGALADGPLGYARSNVKDRWRQTSTQIQHNTTISGTVFNVACWQHSMLRNVKKIYEINQQARDLSRLTKVLGLRLWWAIRGWQQTRSWQLGTLRDEVLQKGGPGCHRLS